MAELAHYIADQEPSPRSTILVASVRMAAAYPVTMNDSTLASDVVSPEVKLPSLKKEGALASSDDLKAASVAESEETFERNQEKDREKEAHDSSPPTPIPHEYAHHLHGYANLTPQQGSGYYLGYPSHQPHMIPEPDSPGPPRTAVYDGGIGSFFQPHSGAAFHPASSGSPFLGVSSAAGNPALSPPRGAVPTVTMTGSIPPASPIFPRMSSGGFDVTSYMVSAQQGALTSNSNNYLPYPSAGLNSQSSDEVAWGGDSRYVFWTKHTP
jgi:hypothetical protein